MDNKFGVAIFYIFILLGVSICLLSLVELDLIWFVISSGLLVCAYLFKHEFKLPVVFWRKIE